MAEPRSARRFPATRKSAPKSTAREYLTHRVDVRAYADAKRRALEADASQASSESDSARTVALLLRLPPPWLFRRFLGHEWFVERVRSPHRLADDLFASLRQR